MLHILIVLIIYLHIHLTVKYITLKTEEHKALKLLYIPQQREFRQLLEAKT